MTIVHELSEFYKEIYQVGIKMPKRERFGLHGQIEKVILRSLGLAIDAALQPRISKLMPIQTIRRLIEIAKHLTRIAQELEVIEEGVYWRYQRHLQELAKMSAGWERFIRPKETPR